MKLPMNLLGGLAGAIVLNVVHEGARRIMDNAPHINEIGEEGVVKIAKATGIKAPEGNNLYATTLAADLAGNAMYYSMIGRGDEKNVWVRGAAYGLAAGLGTLGLTGPIGLNDQPVTKTTLSKVMTVAWYTLGGLAAAAALKLLKARQS